MRFWPFKKRDCSVEGHPNSDMTTKPDYSDLREKLIEHNVLIPADRMSVSTHAYCNTCQKIQPVRFAELEAAITPDDEGDWLAGDAVCTVCYFIIATFFEKAETSRRLDAG